MTLSFCSRICTEKFSTFSYKNNGGYRDQNRRKNGLKFRKKNPKNVQIQVELKLHFLMKILIFGVL